MTSYPWNPLICAIYYPTGGRTGVRISPLSFPRFERTAVVELLLDISGAGVGHRRHQRRKSRHPNVSLIMRFRGEITQRNSKIGAVNRSDSFSLRGWAAKSGSVISRNVRREAEREGRNQEWWMETPVWEKKRKKTKELCVISSVSRGAA